MKLDYIKRCGRFVNDYAAFVKELPDSFSEIGAMLPSSKYLAKEMVRPIRHRKNNKSYRILEIGPGTGPFTKELLNHMHVNDELVVCEINPRLMDRLRISLSTLESFKAKEHKVSFFQGSILDLPKEEIKGGFDLIVSSLPFHNFDPELVQVFLDFYSDILAPGGNITFFHYVGLKKMSEFSPNKQIRNRIKGVNKVISKWCSSASKHGYIRKRVSMLNFPPAVSIEVGTD